MHTDQILDITALEKSLPDLVERYASARPYPHVVLDGLLRPDVLARAYEELEAIPAAAWTNYLHLNERKFANTKPHTWGPTLRSVADELNSERFVRFLAELTGFEGLRPDPSLDGGGLHRCVAGGFLNVHADFTAHHTEQRWRRRVNLLLYLNPEWQPEWGGDLELWTSDMARCETTVAPLGNRLLIFTTTERSYHGHPEPLRAPRGVARQSLALYYFTHEDRIRPRSTDYRARPADGWAGSAGIYADKLALRAYDVVKRRLQLSDASASRWLGALNRSAARARRRRSG